MDREQTGTLEYEWISGEHNGCKFGTIVPYLRLWPKESDDPVMEAIVDGLAKEPRFEVTDE